MSARRDLGIAFIKRRPQSAARVLASKDPADAAAFLQDVPARIAVRALNCMNPRPAARVVVALEASTAGAFLREMPSHQACVLLRRIPTDQRRSLLEHLPRRRRRAFETSLAFAPGTVGAHMSGATAMLEETDRPAEALRLIREDREEHTDVVFVLDSQRRFSSAVSLGALVRAPASATLADLADRHCPALSPNARMESIVNLAAWDEYGRLPVVGRRGEIVGTLPRQALRQRSDAGNDDPDHGTVTVGRELAGALLSSVVGLGSLLLPQPAGRNESGDSHVR